MLGRGGGGSGRVPSCLSECFRDGDATCMDPLKFYQFRRQQRCDMQRLDFLKIIAMCEYAADQEMKQEAEMGGRPKTRGPYARRNERLYRDPLSGELRTFGSRDTEWFRNYVDDPVDTPRFRKKFRRRFRCSYVSYLKHVEDVKNSELFSAWMSRDCVGKESSPIELLVLGSLRYLGRGWCFDDLEEQTCISEETHRKFLHVYILWGSTTLFDKYVRLPTDGEEAFDWANEYNMAGFFGCIGSECILLVPF